MAATHSLDLESSSSQYASIADASCPNLEISGSQTWECWVKLESLPAANMAFMGKSESTAAGWAGLYYNTGTPNTFRFHLHGLTTSSLIGSIATPVAGVWTHVAGVYDGSTLKIYINGELDNSTAASGNHTDSNGNFAIGRLGVYTLNWYYDGLIRNARVWNVARTQQQIRDNMNVDIPVGTGLQGNWILNNSYTDSSANGYTLTASGSPVFSTTYPDAIDLVENQTFTKKHKITVQHTQVAGSANLTDVPIVFTESNFLSEIFSLAKTAGADLRFSSDIDGKTRLAHEIVSFDKGTSKAEVWVKANTLDYDDNTDIYVHYGNATASALDENEAFGKHQVWGENWEGVWHLQGSSVDSSKNSNDGTDTSVSYGASYGKILQGASFNGSTSLINAGTSASLRLQTLTFLAWVDHTPGAYQGIIGPSASNGADFRIENTDKIQLLKSGAVGFGPSSGTLGTGFNHAGVTYNGSSFVYYINGSASGSGTNAQTFSYTGNFQLGSTDGGGAFKLNGYLDQVMVYSGVLSADYIATLYNNQNSPSTFAIPSSLAGGSFLFNFV